MIVKNINKYFIIYLMKYFSYKNYNFYEYIPKIYINKIPVKNKILF